MQSTSFAWPPICFLLATQDLVCRRELPGMPLKKKGVAYAQSDDEAPRIEMLGVSRVTVRQALERV